MVVFNQTELVRIYRQADRFGIALILFEI